MNQENNNYNNGFGNQQSLNNNVQPNPQPVNNGFTGQPNQNVYNQKQQFNQVNTPVQPIEQPQYNRQLSNDLNNNVQFLQSSNGVNVNIELLSKKEQKKIKKMENKKILKATEVVGTNYLITLIIINTVPVLIFKNWVVNSLLREILYYIWYLIMPFLGAYLLYKLDFKKLNLYITVDNYKKIKTNSIINLIILGIFYVGLNFNIYIVPILISYIFSCVYLIKKTDHIFEMKKITK